jgi:hypothetical protein
MRYRLPFLLLASVMPACAFLAKSPALQSPLHERLAKAGTTGIEDATKACLTKEGWKPDDVGGFAEGATVVSAKNAAKERVSVYDDPFWQCLARELASPTPPPPAEPAAP